MKEKLMREKWERLQTEERRALLEQMDGENAQSLRRQLDHISRPPRWSGPQRFQPADEPDEITVPRRNGEPLCARRRFARRFTQRWDRDVPACRNRVCHHFIERKIIK